MSPWHLYFLLVYFILLTPESASAFLLQFKLNGSVLLTGDVQGTSFRPLCESAFKHTYAHQACVADNRGRFVSFSPFSLSVEPLSIACGRDGQCFPFNAPYCTRGIHVDCELDVTPTCPDHLIRISNGCVQLSHTTFPDFNTASDFCFGNVVNPANDADLKEIAKYTTDSSLTFFTAGVRAGKEWLWEDGRPIQQPIGDHLSGRCLGVRKSGLVAVDCHKPAAVLCRSSFECYAADSEYVGLRNATAEGAPCMKWNDPAVLYYSKDADYGTWNHNLCRSKEMCKHCSHQPSSAPGCFVSPREFVECGIPACPEKKQMEMSMTNSVQCDATDVVCGASHQCIPAEFWCDYDTDCDNGADEQNCEDYLSSFELYGAYKIVDKITEIWTDIPHAQGCARRCQNSTLVCEAFSYERKTKTCLLSDSVEQKHVVAPKSTSQYYRRRFSNRELQYRLQADGTLEAAKAGRWAPVCDDGLSPDQTGAVCAIFGFGSAGRSSSSSAVPSGRRSRRAAGGREQLPPPTPPSPEKTPPRRSREPHAVDAGRTRDGGRPRDARSSWTLGCLRSPACALPLTSTCEHIRCSECSEAVCGDGACLSRQQLCDGITHCNDHSDEDGCDDVSYRLVGGIGENDGRVEALLRGRWQPVCASSSALPPAHICKTLHLGPSLNISVLSTSKTTGWNVDCSQARCGLAGLQTCSQLVIKCQRKDYVPSESQCGVRQIQTLARDPGKIKTRLARVVGGFEAQQGSFPWTAAVRLRQSHVHHCGAAIIGRTHLITAAHCFEEDRRPRSYEVVVGDWDNTKKEGTEQVFNVTRFYFYPLYEDLFAHDLAIMEISRPGIEYDTWTQPICLPPRDFAYTAGKKCVVSGWGSTGKSYPARLQAALLPIIDRAKCMNSSKIYQSMSKSAFCAGYLEGGIDSCQGDSGGPMGCEDEEGVFVLAGVISWGDGCAERNQPGIYTMLAPYLTWIENVLAQRTL